MAKFEDLLGKTITVLSVNPAKDAIAFTLDDGSQYMMDHSQDCCEYVSIEDVVGDLNDVVGSPILQAEESSNSDDPAPNSYHESYTWTFYKLATIKGNVTIRWFGSSNGYYSEAVYFRRIRPPVAEVTSNISF